MSKTIPKKYQSSIWSSASPEEVAMILLSSYQDKALQEATRREKQAAKEKDSSRAFFWKWVEDLLKIHLEGALDKEVAVANTLSRTFLSFENAPTFLANSVYGVAERRRLPLMERAALFAAAELIAQNATDIQITPKNQPKQGEKGNDRI